MIDITDAFKEPIPLPERKLWQSVLLEAFVNATAGDKHSIEYLSRPTEDLSQVCDMAGIKMDSVIKGIRKKINPKWLKNIRQSEKCKKKRKPYNYNGL